MILERRSLTPAIVTRGMGFSVGVVTFLLLSIAPSVLSDTFNKTFDSFTGIADALPFDCEVVVSPDNGTYDITLTGPSEVTSALRAEVTSDGTLELGFKDRTSFRTTSNVNYTIRMPTQTLERLAFAGTGKKRVEGSVCTADTFTFDSSGAINVMIMDIPSSSVTAQSSGSGTAVITGSNLEEVDYSGAGSSTLYIGGVTDTVKLEVAGSGDVYIASGSDNLQITGKILGMGKVHYDKGSCDISGLPFVGGNSCSKESVTLPESA